MLTPHDIEGKAFTVSLRGYNSAEVDDFLQEIIDDFVDLTEENKKLKIQIKNLSEAVTEYKSMEDTLTGALKVADKSANEIKNGAAEKAKEVIDNAKSTASSMIAGAEQRLTAEAYRFETIKREVELYKTKIIELLNAQLNILKEYPISEALDISELKENAQKQRMWQRQNTSFPNRNGSDNLSDEIENTADLGQTALYEGNTEKTAAKSTKTGTANLPRVHMDENGNYIVSDNK